MQIKSRQRVTDHGEVFTAEREVRAMLDLVNSETMRIESRFLEPACGDGNFLAEVLRRKIAIIKDRHAADFERYTLLAVSTLYGIDILQDNVCTCRERLLRQVDGCASAYRNAVKYIISLNIIWGNTLTLRTPDKKQTLITFPEWSLGENGMIQRRDHTLSSLFSASYQTELFENHKSIEYPPVHYLKLGRDYANT